MRKKERFNFNQDFEAIPENPKTKRFYKIVCIKCHREVGNGERSIRRLTPVECEKLQGFPGNWTEGFPDTQRYKMLGNAVTVNVIEEIAKKIDEK